MDPIKKKKLLGVLWEVFKTFLLTTLRDKIIKSAIKAFLGTATGAGIQAWIVKYIVTEFYDEIAEPLIKAGLVEVEYGYYKIEGEVLIKKLKGADNAEEYNSTVDDILS